MNKAQLVTVISHQTEMNQEVVRKLVDSMLDTIAQTIQQGETIKLYKFGTFIKIERGPRKVRAVGPKNLKKGQDIPYKEIPPRRTILFKPSRKWRERLN
jgi:nucleoid DNA-binding protein